MLRAKKMTPRFPQLLRPPRFPRLSSIFFSPQPLALSPFTRGFTTIELLFVILLISLLLALLSPGIRTLHRDALKRRAQTELQTLSQALHNYQLAYGTLPQGISSAVDNTLNIEPLLPNSEHNPRAILFITIPPSRLKYETTLDGFLYLDPWGTPYRIFYHPNDKEDSAITGFTLISYGPNKTRDINISTTTFQIPQDSDDLFLQSF